MFRQLARKLGVGRALLFLRDAREYGVRMYYATHKGEKAYRQLIIRARPIPCGGPSALPVHMLLHDKRMYEGMWGLYSLAHFAQTPLQFVVHDDGTLQEHGRRQLEALFPNCRVIARDEGDRVTLEHLQQRGLHRCVELRRQFIFALKLFDPVVFAGSEQFILLDSDVLFFSHPKELVGDANGAASAANSCHAMFSVDNGYRYPLNKEDWQKVAGVPCTFNVNPGVLRVCRNLVDFGRIEAYLQHPSFYGADGRPNFYTELTLWAMELLRSGASPLPESYAICPALGSPDLVSGHFCGGAYGRNLYYTQGLPKLACSLGLSAE